MGSATRRRRVPRPVTTARRDLILFAAGFALWLLAIVLPAQSAPLSLVSTAWPPFTNPPGEPRFALDLVESALGRIGLGATTTIVDAAAFTPALLTGPFDGSAAAWNDAERERVLVFSDPYLENRLVLVGRHGAAVSAAALTDLAGARVAIVEGYSYGEAVERGGPVFVRSRSEEDSLTRLLAADVDYTLMDELVVQYIVRHFPEESAARLQIGTTALITRPLYFAVRRSRPDADSIVSRFNSQLRGMIADGTYHRLLHVDWIRADVTGDGLAENVALDERVGPSPPQRVYALFSPTDTGLQAPSAARGFYIGGTLYSDWASVPASYKEVNPRHPDSRRSAASVFKFAW